MPAGSQPPEVTYMLLSDLEGWDSSGSSANLRTGNTVAWMGATVVQGPNTQSEVGLEYDEAETTPSTNGLWEATQDGLLEITLGGIVQYNHLGTGQVLGVVRTQLYNLLASGGSNAIYQTTTGGYRVLEARTEIEYSATFGGTAPKGYSYERTNLVFVNAGDRLSIRWQLLDGTDLSVLPFAFTNTMRVRRMGDSDVTSDNLF